MASAVWQARPASSTRRSTAPVISRFDLVYTEILELVHAAVLCAQIPLLLVTGYHESRLDLREGPQVAPEQRQTSRSNLTIEAWLRPLPHRPGDLATTVADHPSVRPYSQKILFNFNNYTHGMVNA